MNKTTETWGERMAREAGRLVARHRPPAPSLEWLAPFIRRVVQKPASPARFARTEPPARALPPPPPSPIDEGLPLPPDVRERLRDAIGPGVERARVHQGEAADAVARAHGAEAVTIGDHVMF